MITYKLKDNDRILDSIATSFGRTYTLKVRDLPNEEKPREKLLSQGPKALATNDLIAIVLGTGNKKEGVLEIASRITKEYGEKTLAHHTDPEKMAEDLNISLNQAMQLVAVSELGRRFFDTKSGRLAVIRTPEDVFNHVVDMRDLPKEHLRGVYLNSHHMVIHEETISIGTIASSVVHPREVFKPAIEYGAAAVILVHNHPSGISTPSQSDIEITRQIVVVGNIVGINLIDHVIVTKDGYQSIEVDYQ
jgi:DNA repair protein RadC